MNEQQRTYPYTAWVLQPSFKPKQVELTRAYGSWGTASDYDSTSTGKPYHLSELLISQKDAIAAGRQALERQRIDLDKKLVSLAKKQEALDKAEKEAA